MPCFYGLVRSVFGLVLLFVLTSGCAVPGKKVFVRGMEKSFKPGTIISAQKAAPITFEQLISELENARVVFVGERHTNIEHHNLQLEIIRALYKGHPDLKIGMEMFDHTYQPVLDKWSRGELTEDEFLKQTHWYANWKFNYGLYRDILAFAREKNIPVVGLNIPFHIPSKISIGGIGSLSEYEKAQLPEKITTDIEAHRKYVKEIFEQHHLKGREDFENFYMAQNVWEDAMAEAVVRHLGNSLMVVLAGNGHIVEKFGIPDRVSRRLPVPVKTIYPVSAGATVELSYADFIIVTEQPKHPPVMAGH